MRKKVYGSYHVDNCVFCGRQATVKNPQKFPVCQEHIAKKLEDIKCACGDWLDIREGKFGTFFTCFHCGAISLHKGLEMMRMTQKKEVKKDAPTPRDTARPREVTVRSDDPLYFS
ncbi:MAG: hypothetical protein ABIH41_04565 [Nanoarchaeota archaeon]